MMNTKIEFGTGWNCCAANPAKVIVWDNGSRWAVCTGCASRYIGEVQELPAAWIPGTRLMNATNAEIRDLDDQFVQLDNYIYGLKIIYRRDNGQRGHVETHAVEIAERPTNAKSRREHAISVFLYKWAANPEFNLREACRDLDTMAAMGRTPRWKASMTDWKNNLTMTNDKEYVITQYAIFANFSA